MRSKVALGVLVLVAVVLLAVAVVVWRNTILYEPAKPPFLPPLPSEVSGSLPKR